MNQYRAGASDHRREALRGYGGRHEARAEVARPRTVGELRDILVLAAREGRSVTLRGGGQSIDDRAIGRDLIISTERLDAIDVDAAGSRVTVGPGATWGEILRRLPRGLVPHVVVTTSAATAGGTLSADCISRFSPGFGRESRHVVRFDLMTVDGRILTCAPDGEHRDVFAAVTAGLGYVGVIVGITHALLDLRARFDRRPADEALRVETHARLHAGFEPIVADLLAPRAETGGPEAVYAIAGVDGRGVVHRSRYVAGGGPLRALPVARRPDLRRLALECLMWRASFAQAAWSFGFSLYYRRRTRFLDELFGFTFCMDANVRAIALYRRLGGEAYVVQQTFVIPGSPATVGASAARVAGFMREASRRLLAHGFPPTLFDVLHLPPDPGRDGGGLAVTAAWVLLDRARVDALAGCLVELSTLCACLGGHIHLVKDVHARAEDLAAMHAGRLEALFAVRARLDPGGVMRNDFLDRVLVPARDACRDRGRTSESRSPPAMAPETQPERV